MRQVKKSAILPATIGARIRAARQALGLSQVALAELLEVPQGQVSQWETGREPGAVYLRRLADALGTTIDELVP